MKAGSVDVFLTEHVVQNNARPRQDITRSFTIGKGQRNGQAPAIIDADMGGAPTADGGHSCQAPRKRRAAPARKPEEPVPQAAGAAHRSD